MADNFSDDAKLSPRMKRGITALLTERDVRDVAAVVKVTERTVYRWLTLPEFKSALNKAENDLISECGRRLIAGQAKALGVLEKIMDTAIDNNDKRLAAVAWLNFSAKFQELNHIESRLSELEAVVFKQSNGKKR